MAKKITYAQVSAETGIPIATVGRRVKAGETVEQIIAQHKAVVLAEEILANGGQPPEPELPVVDDEIEMSSLEWANAVLWAAKHCSTKNMTRRKAGSQMRFALWQFGQENAKELVVQLATKALGIRDKHNQQGTNAEVEAAENADIRDLEELLEGALAEAAL